MKHSSLVVFAHLQSPLLHFLSSKRMIWKKFNNPQTKPIFCTAESVRSSTFKHPPAPSRSAWSTQKPIDRLTGAVPAEASRRIFIQIIFHESKPSFEMVSQFKPFDFTKVAFSSFGSYK